MECSRVRDLLPDYSVEILDARTRHAVSTHLSGCADCRAELRAMDSVMQLVEQHAFVEPPPGLFNAVRNQIEAGTIVRERPAWWSFLFTRPARMAAMGMAMSAVVLGLMLPTGPSPSITPGPLPVHHGAAMGSMATGDLASSIRQHAMSAAEGPLPDRVAWEAMAQLATQATPGQEPDELPDQRRSDTRRPGVH